MSVATRSEPDAAAGSSNRIRIGRTFGSEGADLAGRLKPLPALFSEEERSKQPSVFSILRALIEEFRGAKDSRLGLVGAFGYDLLFQFEPIEMKLPRDGHKDLHLFLCDDIYFMDRKKEQIERYQYDFERDGVATVGARSRRRSRYQQPASALARPHRLRPHAGEYMANVETVREGMRRATTTKSCCGRRSARRTPAVASELFERVQTGQPESLRVSAAVRRRATGRRVARDVRARGRQRASRPARFPAPRGARAIRCATPTSIRELLNSTKEESELTMCTDVDRNDKSRVCVPGSVKVIGRRLIESYAGVFHTVDHVEGTLAAGFDSLDAFLATCGR